MHDEQNETPIPVRDGKAAGEAGAVTTVGLVIENGILKTLLERILQAVSVSADADLKGKVYLLMQEVSRKRPR